MTKPIVHMIGQAHLDPVWLWRWTEGRAEALATSQSAVDRLAEYPDFHFTRGESQVYRWIEEENPQLLDRIRALIDEGRWHVVNGMIIQPDMNIPCGESFVRQVLLGKAYMQANLGVEPRIAYCVDSFGHAGTLPQILRGCGFDAYVFMRPGPHEKELPANVFWWQAPDGSRIPTFRIAEAYTTRTVDQADHIDAALAAMPDELNETMCFFGVGNHGGGPTKAQIENVRAIAQSRDDVEIRFSWPDAYFDAAADRLHALPTVAEELQFHAVGCYSAVSDLKHGYRQAENALLLAERMATLAEFWADRPFPQERFHELWHELSFNQFHDTLGGSSVREAENDAIRALGGITHQCERLIDDAGRQIGALIDTTGAGEQAGSIIVFNPFAQPLQQFVEYEPWTNWEQWSDGGWSLVDDVGEPVPYQLIETHEALSSARSSLNRLVFEADVPSFGYRVYRFARGMDQPELAGCALAHEDALENDRLRVELDLSSGNIVSCVDKATEMEFVGAGGWNVGQVLDDDSDTWSHDVRCYGAPAAAFGNARLQVVDTGPLQASLLIERSFNANRWVQQIILRYGDPQILIRNWLTWQGEFQMIKLACDVAVDAPRGVHDVPFGWCERETDGAEVPTHMWMDVCGASMKDKEAVVGTALLNDGRYGCDVDGSVMRLTILRSPPYAYHRPHVSGSKHRYDWIDQGFHAFTLAILPHVGPWQESNVVQRAREINMQVPLITMHAHAGQRPKLDSLLELTSPEMELTAFKLAEDGDGYIMRVADRHGRGGEGDIRWLGAVFHLSVKPFQVLTFRLSQRSGGWTVAECDMLERS
jgi:alpha-mannosidase